MEVKKDCLIHIRSLYPEMFEVEKKIADYILEKPEDVIHMTVAQISKSINVAESSIVRFCQKLGFNGFSQLKINIAKNIRKPEAMILEDISRNDTPVQIVKKVFSSSIQALNDTLEMLDGEDFKRAVDAIVNAKRIEFYGIGTSATIASDAYFRFMRIGLPAYAATDPFIFRISASMLAPGSVAVGISYSGRTKDIIETLRIAKSKGASTICITGFAGSPITELCDIKLITSTSETKIMKEAVSSRLAQIALLDSLYTCVAMKNYDSVMEKLYSMAEIYDELRY